MILLLWSTHRGAGKAASVSAAALDFAAASLLFVLSTYEHHRTVAPSTIIAFYLLLSLPFDVARLRTLSHLGTDNADALSTIEAASIAIKSLTLIAELIEKRSNLLSAYRHLPPEETSGILNRSVFWWINPLLWTGFANPLQASNLYELDSTLDTKKVERKFRLGWQSISRPGRYALVWLIFSILKWQFILAAIPRLLLIAVRYTQPFLIESAISFVTNHASQSSSVGWSLCAAYSLTFFSTAIFNALHHHFLNRCVSQIRGGLISLIYSKTLDLSITALDPSASLTLMSSDVQRITQAMALFNDAWVREPSVANLNLSSFIT